MKIRGLSIEKFGGWSGLDLKLPSRGLVPIYGPNEAGKTTLMHFLRGMLFDSWNTDLPREREPAEGTLSVQVEDRTYTIRRVRRGERAGLLTVTTSLHGDRDTAEPEDSEEILQQLRQGIDASIFENVYAVGLREMQELSTLDGHSASELIYGMSLGPDGRRLLRAIESGRNSSRQLFDGSHARGSLADAARKYTTAVEKLRQFEGLQLQHQQLQDKRSELDEQIAELKERQSGLQVQRRGHLLMDQLWQPWNQLQNDMEELDDMPVVSEFPKDGLELLEELNGQIRTAENCRQTLRQEIATTKEQLAALELDPVLQRFGSEIRALIRESTRMEEFDAQCCEVASRRNELRQAFHTQLQDLGSEWSVARVIDCHATPERGQALQAAADDYRRALGKRSRRRRRYERRSRQFRQSTNDLQETLRDLPGGRLDRAIEQERQRLTGLTELQSLMTREHELRQKILTLQAEQCELEDTQFIPRWGSWVLGGFAGGGLALMAAGISRSVNAAVLIGAIYTLLGASSLGLAFAFSYQLRASLRERRDALDSQIERAEGELREVCLAIDATLARTDSDGQQRDPQLLASLIRKTTRRKERLERSRQQQSRITRLREWLTEQRQVLQQHHQHVAETRAAWCNALRSIGMDETLQVTTALDAWAKLLTAKSTANTLHATESEYRLLSTVLDGYRRRVERVLQHDGDAESHHENIFHFEVVARWAQLIKHHRRDSRHRAKLKRQLRSQSAEQIIYDEQLHDLQRQRSALLSRGGAATVDEFENRYQAYLRRAELQQRIEQTQQELQRIQQTAPDLAIVEDDLVNYDHEHNSGILQMLNLESEDLERDLEQACEQLGTIKQQCQQLAECRRYATERLDCEEARERLRQQLTQWAAHQSANAMLLSTRTAFERDCQPQTLADASDYLAQLTCGRYRRVWTPLGERGLRLEDARGVGWLVDDVSNGTREQLFLAIRLAMIDAFERQGISLPIVFDDVIVNFDEQRTDAALQVLLDYANRRQQILYFTCHRHIVERLSHQGIDVINLPSRASTLVERQAG